MRTDDGLENFLNNNSGPLMQNAWEPLVSISKSPLSHRETEEALCLWLQSMWLWDNMNIRDLISYSCLSPDHVLQTHTHKKVFTFPSYFLHFLPFYPLKSHCQTPGNKQFKSHLLLKSNWCSQKIKNKQKGSSLSCRADHIVLTHSCAASQGWALTGISHHVLGYTTGSGNPFIQWQWVLQLNYALCE